MDLKNVAERDLRKFKRVVSKKSGLSNKKISEETRVANVSKKY